MAQTYTRWSNTFKPDNFQFNLLLCVSSELSIYMFDVVDYVFYANKLKHFKVLKKAQ